MVLAALVAATAPPSAVARLLAPAPGGRTSLRGVSGVQKLVLDRAALATLRASDHATVLAFPLARERTVDLVLQRFSPFAPGVRAEAIDNHGSRPVALPDEVYFRGTIAGEGDSRVLLVAGPDRVHGFVVSGGDVFPFGPDALGGHLSYALRNADPLIYPPPGDFCANDVHPEAVAVPEDPLAPAADAPAAADTSGALKLAEVAIDTDQELRAKFPSDAAALSYLTSLAAAATAIYERDVAVRLQFSYIRLWDTTDPWTATNPGAALSEVQTYWNDPANQMDTIAGPRTIVHFVSGKTVQGGVAYVGVLCNATYGYGVSQVYGSFDLSQPSQIWDVLVFTHEVGHNFGSPHTHCYAPPVDECYNQEAGCYAGPIVCSRGTIMSYCHLNCGGLPDMDLVFGNVVSARIGQTVSAATCLATVPPPTTTTTTTLPASTSTTSTSTTQTTSTTTVTIRTTTSTTARPTTTTSTTLTTSTTTMARPTTTNAPTTTTAPTASSTTSSTSPTSTTGTSSTATTTTSPSTSTTIKPTTSTTVTTTPSTITTSTTAAAPSTSTTLPASACPGTAPGDVVDARGCSLCPCDGPRGGGPWPSRSAYLRCVREAVKLRVAQGALTRRQQRSALERARQSSCGATAKIRCCLYAGANDVTGRCRVMRGAACATHVLTGAAANLGPGSCFPSPCAR